MRAKYAILDYDHRDDSRIDKIFVGPLISVIIPTYKRKELVEKAVDSVIVQDYKNVEIIVVGDNCPVLPSLMRREPHSILRVYNLSKNHGSGGAVPRNVGITMAAGKYIAYLDDDNEISPNHLSSVYEAMRREDVDFGFSSMLAEGVDLKFNEPKHGGIDTSCVVHAKDLVRKKGFWKNRVDGGYAHDWEFFSRMLGDNEKWVCTKQPTVIYNVETSGQPDFLRAKIKEIKKGK
jgi:glycosyltransferase involved in cell wall biosynthesis